MSEKSINFNQEFIPKILDGTKTQTRRPKKTDIAKYQTGDILWVKESYSAIPGQNKYIYKSDYTGCDGLAWKRSDHMPKEAARIWLRVTDVRVERVQDISEEDAEKEGCAHTGLSSPFGTFISADEIESAREEFQRIWNSIYKKKGWDTNPYVFVYEFERIER